MRRHVICMAVLWMITVLFGVGILAYEPEARTENAARTEPAPAEARTAVSSSIMSDVAQDPDGPITKTEAAKKFGDALGTYPAVSETGRPNLTAAGFLDMMSAYGKYIIQGPDGPAYLLGDSNFMTQAEFNALAEDGDRELTRTEFGEYIDRTEKCNAFLSKPVTDVRGFEDLLWGYYREFWDLYETNTDSGRYWLRDVFSAGLGYERFSSVLHETAHEESARRSYGYVNRSCANHDWKVIWLDNVSSMHPYNLAGHGFKQIDITPLPRTSDVLKHGSVPKCVRDTVWFNTYVEQSDAISNMFSIYGMTEEFCANMVDVKCAVISDIIKYRGQSLDDDDLKPYYFWTSLICTYLSQLKEYDKNTYESVISDANLMGLIRGTYAEINSYLAVVKPAYSNAWDSVALKSWYESAETQLAITEYLAVQ